MQFETIVFERQDGYAELRLNRPDTLNSFNSQMHEEVATALDQVATGNDIRALFLTAAGKGFCAGQDLNDRNVKAGSSVDLGQTLDTLYNPLIRRLRELPLPVVCGVNGVAAGAGANVALAADIVVAARSARFIQAFCKIGLLPDSGGTWVLPRLLGDARARAQALLGEPIGAEQAADWGMIYKCVDDAALRDTCIELCRHFATQPTRGLAAIKQALLASWDHSLDTQLDFERDVQRELGRSDDYREGVAAFLEKRKPEFRGS
ncbi:MAG: 2-(1,2-epoxy-1,2-dihydrophenyl)acetyl-CoA isomerase [Gammaproteobacteria bacterium]|nr:2-(1,2-epoxy-1,2-dihydrophenyl)acetyl-CoA isomerase [Gammaproteobacteria bacterium]